MVEVTLREYCEEIEGLIDQGAFDAAISHCQHILKVYPKYLKAYSLMGKTALEKGDLEAAADLFSRVLTMDPEDFVARVGMSIASDKEGSLDHAVWHMERAFELAPDNQAIVGELRRLYGRRDGMEPDKVKLTQGALARLHARGNLYTQAINEQRHLLRIEPDRVDLQVALAETLWRADRRIEAAEVSLAILEKLPYCLKANLILGEIWSSSGREIEGAGHLERAQMIDPENEVAQDLFGERSPLPLTDVHIGRMEYVAPPAPAEQEPDWLQALIEEDTSPAAVDAAVPSWLQAVAASAAVEATAPDDTAPETDLVPEWLQDVAATADMDAEEFVTAPETPAPSEAEMPEWLTEILPDEAGIAAVDEEEPTGAELAMGEDVELAPGEIPDWLTEMAPTDAGPIEAELESDELVDWLAETTPTEIMAPIEAESDLAEAEDIELAPGEIPEWLAEMASVDEEVPTEAEPVAAELAAEDVQLEPGEIPEWLVELAPTEEEPVDAEDLGLAPAEIPDWLTEKAPADEVELSVEVEPSGAEPVEAEEIADMAETAPPPLVAAETPDWLSELVEAAGATMEEEPAPSDQLAEPEEEELPEWLAELEQAPEVPEMETTPPVDELPGLEEDELPEWLAELETSAAAIEVPELETALPADELPELEEEELPEWLTELETSAAATEVGEAEEEVVDAEAELMARMEEMSPEEAFAAWEAMLAESEELAPEEAALISEDEAAPDAEAELMTGLEEMSPEEAFAAWEAMLAESELEEAISEPEALQPDTRPGTGPIVIEEPDKETLVYPEGAGGQVTDAEAELMARMEEMSPEEAFAAWEAMLAEGEERAPEEAEEEIILDAETELMASLDEMSPEEAFAAWEAMLAESEELAQEEAALTLEEVEEEVLLEDEAELMTDLDDMSPEEAFAAWEAMLAEGEELAQEEEAPEAELVAGAEDAWMALIEDEIVEAAAAEESVAPTPVEEPLSMEPVAELDQEMPALVVDEELAAEPVADLDQAWMTLAEDEGLEEITAPPTEEAPIAAPLAALETAEDEVEEEIITAPIPDEQLSVTEVMVADRAEELEAELPPWTTTEAVEEIEAVSPPTEQEITMGPDLVLLTEEEEVEIELPREPEPAAPVEVTEFSPEVEEPTEEPVTFVAAAEAVVPTEVEAPADVGEIEEKPPELPISIAAEEEAVSEAPVEEVPKAEEKIAEPEGDQARLFQARELWTAGQEEAARIEYERLLRSPFRSEVTADLERLAAEESVDEPTLRLLGDAYMKADRLQDALEAYRRALSSL